MPLSPNSSSLKGSIWGSAKGTIVKGYLSDLKNHKGYLSHTDRSNSHKGCRVFLPEPQVSLPEPHVFLPESLPEPQGLPQCHKGSCSVGAQEGMRSTVLRQCPGLIEGDVL